jgi:tetratricopeptide (TPR) repeat protein
MVKRYLRVAEEIYEKENNADVALLFIQKAMDLDSDNPEGCFLKAYMQGMAATRHLLNLDRPLTKEELDAAHTAYAEALSLEALSPRRPEPYILQGQILSALKETSRARNAIAKALRMQPNNVMAHIRMAMIHLDDKSVSEAEKSLDRAIELDSTSKWAWLWKGIILSEYKNDQKKARACYDKALSFDNKFDLAYYNRGWTFASGAKKRYDLARAEMKKALEVNPGYKEACYAMGMFYGYEDNYPIAKIWLEKAIDLDSKFLIAHKWKGIVCGEMQEYEDAIRSFDEAIKLDPMNADLYVRRARMNMSLNRNDMALRDLCFADELSPRSQRTLLYLGDLHLKMNDAEKALEYYESALKVDSKSDDAFARKASALAALKLIDEALAALDSAIAVSEYKPERFLVDKAVLLDSIGKLDAARDAYVKARTIDPKFLAAWEGEAKVCRKLKDINGWRVALSTYIELKPTDVEARRELLEKW